MNEIANEENSNDEGAYPGLNAVRLQWNVDQSPHVHYSWILASQSTKPLLYVDHFHKFEDF